MEFHSIIKPETRPAIEQHLKAAKPENRQAMLDELAAYMSSQSGQGRPVRNPAAVVRRMVQRDQAGQYVPEQAHIGAAMRKSEQARQKLPMPDEKKPRMIPPGKLIDCLKGNFNA